jgi:pimeloyl-ACP methyl ester carboxylesterase
VPTLFVSGDEDGGTPLSFMEHAAVGFSQSVKVLARGQGHTEWSSCIEEIYKRFLESGSIRELGGAGCEAIPRPAFKISP